MKEYKFHETKEALSDKKIILKSYPKAMQNKLRFYVMDILENPRNLNTLGEPEELKHKNIPTYSRRLNNKDRITTK